MRINEGNPLRIKLWKLIRNETWIRTGSGNDEAVDKEIWGQFLPRLNIYSTAKDRIHPATVFTRSYICRCTVRSSRTLSTPVGGIPVYWTRANFETFRNESIGGTKKKSNLNGNDVTCLPLHSPKLISDCVKIRGKILHELRTFKGTSLFFLNSIFLRKRAFLSVKSSSTSTYV